MSTNFTLKSLDYSNYEEKYFMIIYFPFIQIVLGKSHTRIPHSNGQAGVAYFCYKIYLSYDDDDE